MFFHKFTVLVMLLVVLLPDWGRITLFRLCHVVCCMLRGAIFGMLSATDAFAAAPARAACKPAFGTDGTSVGELC